MKNVTLWIVIGAIALFALGLFGSMVMPFGWNNSAFGYGCANNYGMMGFRGYMPMMGGMGGWGMMPFGMLFMWLVPLGVLALIVCGIFWLVRTLTQKQASPS